ncbi:hypothetical protein KPL39_10840 [Clostridium gasigenes]|uniref:hypothetical protein n=1 Tax=Clostridium gasigenes TaxID=94869 RepID=UPI001C0BE04F|nr:hypothetical protein [Clostridium gasigenes]MBU3136762.1 hypothetical protein [Clostridium gasigenes]
MKSYTIKAKLEGLGVLSSYSRPRVSNDNAFSESHFKTMKYRQSYRQDGFYSIEAAQKLNPLRFQKGTRNWNPPEIVSLNPTDEVKEKIIDRAI